jgi:hypothetical protein
MKSILLSGASLSLALTILSFADVGADAPSTNPASPALLDRAAFPSGLTLDVQQSLSARDQAEAVTLSFGALGDPRAPGLPGADGLLGRVGASVTLGGPNQGEAPGRISLVQTVTRHFTAEIRVALLGIRGEQDTTDTPVRVGLGLVADTYATGFGRDLYAATLIADGSGAFSMIANAGYRAEEAVHTDRKEEFKLGAGLHWRTLSFGSRAAPLDVIVGEGVLLRNEGRAPVWLENARVEVPMHPAVHLIGGVTWSNHPERPAGRVVRASLEISCRLLAPREAS